MNTLLSLPTPSLSITTLSWDPTGQFIAGACADGTALIWHVRSGQVLFHRRVTHGRLVRATWSQRGQQLALAGANHSVTLLQVRDGAIVLSHLFDAPVNTIAFAPRGGRFLVAAGSVVSLYQEGRSHPVQLVHPSSVLDIAWSPTGGRFAAVCEHGDVSVYNALRRRRVYTLGELERPRSVAWNSNGRELAVGVAGGSIHIHDGSSGEPYTSYRLSRHSIEHLAWGNPCLVAIDARAEVTLWDLLPRESSVVLAARYPGPQSTLALSPNGEHLALGLPQGVCVAPVA